MTSTPVYALDQCERKGSVLLIQGWALPIEDGNVSVCLYIDGLSKSGESWRIELPIDQDRPDVRSAYTTLGEGPCGFFFYGRIPEGSPEALTLSWANGITRVLLRFEAEEAGKKRINRIMWVRSMGRLGRQALGLVTSGQFSLLKEKFSRRFATARTPMQRLDEQTIATLSDLQRPVLLIDHELGGGANLFRNHWIEEQTLLEKHIVLITFSIVKLAYIVTLFSATDRRSLGAYRCEDLGDLIVCLSPKKVVYNNAVAFPDAQELIQTLVRYKQSSEEVSLGIIVHDYFAICPSAHLVNAESAFCGVPDDLTICASCLQRSHQPFVSLYPLNGIEQWRSDWMSLLQAAEWIRFFSASSIRFFQKAYPKLNISRFILQPHIVESLSSADRKAFDASKVRNACKRSIVVVGSISAIKGSKIVRELAQWLELHNSAWVVRVIGSVSPTPRVSTKYFRETGPYQKDQLTQLVLEFDPDVFLFPSIAPETFSLVLHEIARYDLPIAAFDIGAQGDFVSDYHCGIKLPNAAIRDSQSLVQALDDYFSANLEPS